MAKKKKKGISVCFNQLATIEKMFDSKEIPAILKDSPYRMVSQVLRYYYFELQMRGDDLLVAMTTFINEYEIDFFGSLDELLSEESLSKLTPLHREDKSIKFYSSEIEAIKDSNLTLGAKRLFFAMLWYKKVKQQLDSEYLVDNTFAVYKHLDKSLSDTATERNKNIMQLAQAGFIKIGMTLDSQLQLKEFEEDEVVLQAEDVYTSKEAFDTLIGSLRVRKFVAINLEDYTNNGTYNVLNSLQQTIDFTKVPKGKINEICANTRFSMRGWTFIEITDGRLLLDEYSDLLDKLVKIHMTQVRIDFSKMKKQGGFKLEVFVDTQSVQISTL